MSIRVMSRVWEESSHSGAHLLMLLAVADFADDQGRAYPSVATLAQKCRVKARAANYTIRDLKNNGELDIKLGAGPRGTNMYRILLDRLGAAGERHDPPHPDAALQAVAPLQVTAPLHAIAPLQQGAPLQKPAALQPGANTPAPGCMPPLQQGADKPSLNHQDPLEERYTHVDSLDVSYPQADGGAHPKAARKRQAASQFVTCEQLVAEGVQQTHAKDWLAIRAAKRSPLTATAWEATKVEAAKAGISIDEAVKLSAVRGWAGFRAEWVEEPSRAGSSPTERRTATVRGLTGTVERRVATMAGLKNIGESRVERPAARFADHIDHEPSDVVDVAGRVVG